MNKRNPGLTATDDNGEVEVDFEALDNETLWELDSFLRLHRKAAASRKRKEQISNSTSTLQQTNKVIIYNIS